MTIVSPFMPERQLRDALARNWWLVLARGAVAVLFGVAVFVFPGLALVTLVLLFGAFTLIDGALALTAALSGGAPAPRWWLAVVGLLGIAAGGFTLAAPDMTALVLVYIVAIWSMTTGVMQIVGALRLRQEIHGEMMLIVSGALSLLFGIALTLWPAAGALTLVVMLGLYAVLFGAMMVGLGVRLRAEQQR